MAVAGQGRRRTFIRPVVAWLILRYLIGEPACGRQQDIRKIAAGVSATAFTAGTGASASNTAMLK